MKAKTVFLFDLDSTITKVEILPAIARKINKEAEMRELTEKTMNGDLPFCESLRMRVDLLKDIDVREVSDFIEKIPLNDKLVKFMRENRDNCYVVTGNLNVWIEGLMKRLGMSDHCFCSHAIVKDGRVDRLEKILKKEEALGDFTDAMTVAVGDGSNDFKMLSGANVGIAFGGVREVAPILHDVVDYSVYDEKRLVSLLSAINGGAGENEKSVIISCAGMGTRLGMGKPKALIDICGKTLIDRTLAMLKDISDVRVVVGYKAEDVVKTAKGIRSDLLFVYNRDYKNNGTGASVCLAARYAGKYILTIDGDVLIHPDDMKKIVDANYEFVGVTTPSTDDPVLTLVDKDGLVCGFSRESGVHEWTGITCLETNKVGETNGHTYSLVEQRLPLPEMMIREKEIDTPNDYRNAICWVVNGYKD